MTFGDLTIPLAWGAASHLAIWTAGSWARARLRRHAPPEIDPALDAFQSAMLGFVILGAAAFALAAARCLYAPLLAAIVASLAAAGIVRIARARPSFRPRTKLSGAATIASALFVVAHLPNALYPVLEHDESVYHLLLPKLYLAAHGLVFLPWSWHANMPHLVDLTFVFPMAFGGFTAAKVFVLGFIAWTIVGLAPFGRDMLGPSGPGLLAVLYLSGRVVQWHLGLAYVEPVIGALLLGALQALWRYGEEGGKAELHVLAILAGAACASKYTVWPHAAVLLVAAGLARPKVGPRPGLEVVPVVAGLCGLLVVPWLVKGALVTGNPIYPNAYGIFGGRHWSEIQAVQLQKELAYGSGAEKDLGTYLTLPLRLVTGGSLTSTLGAASFSASVMVLLLASMAFPWRRREFGTTLRLLSIAGFVFWCLGCKQIRFLVAFVPVMVVACGLALAPLRRFRAALGVVTLAVVTLALAQIRWQPYPTEPVLDVFTVPRGQLLTRNWCWDVAQLLNRIVPEGGRVLSFWENRLYFLDRPFFADSTYGAPTALAALREAGDAHAFAVTMAAEGVTHVVVNPYVCELYLSNKLEHDLIDPKTYPVARFAADQELFGRFLSAELEQVSFDGAWLVFRLKAAAGTGGAGSSSAAVGSRRRR